MAIEFGEMFAPLVESGAWLKRHWPNWLKLETPGFSFILIHYMYMIGMTILGSILVYPVKNVRYIDSLFFASGAATQSGLNPIDFNQLTFYQQFVLYMIPMVCNPIFINSFVVFVRLYWFEKEFQGIVEGAREQRRSRMRSRTKSEAREDRDIERAEESIRNRKITIVRGHPAAGPIDGDDRAALDQKVKDAMQDEESSNSSDRALQWQQALDQQPTEKINDEDEAKPTPGHQREIMFADEVDREQMGDSPTQRMPQRISTNQHIAFLENQRKHDKGALRIPGPLDFERGEVPIPLDDTSDHDFANEPIQTEANADEAGNEANAGEEINLDDHPAKRGITFNEPEHPEHPHIKDVPTYTSGSRHFGLHGLGKRQSGDPKFLSGLRQRTRSFREHASVSRTKSEERDTMPYLSWQATVGRNSLFVDLTEEQREELGGIEYRALKTLAIILVIYFFGFHLLGVLSLLPWIMRSGTYGPVVTGDGQGRPWWGIFTPASMFNDLGYTLTPDSMNSFPKAVWPLLLGSFLIVIGNTGFPCMLRFVIWAASLVVRQDSGLWEELRFLLDHPRRCFTLLFPSKDTWWLFWVLVLLNGIDLIFFIILDLDDPTVTSLAPGIRVLDGLFQAASTRTAGFSCVTLSTLHPAIQVSYLIMMYISVFPIAISVRKTNVYEEQALGLYPAKDEDDAEQSYLGAHLRRQLSFDLWYVFLGLFFISIIEGSRIQNTNDYAFSIFTVLFEIVSAYGTVGLSLGYPNINASFSSQLKVLSKLIIIAMEIRGRHRGLPYALDRAILLPNREDHAVQRSTAQRRNSVLGPGLDGLRPTIPNGNVEKQEAGGLGSGNMRDRSNSRTRSNSAVRGPETPGPYTPGLSRLISGVLSAGPTLPRKYD
ncbi:MAG: low affinity potassium transporter [Bogoriella megaspora]|nr:MAG: low affinity potassium transporter [Bogoriella megaspora]